MAKCGWGGGVVGGGMGGGMGGEMGEATGGREFTGCWLVWLGVGVEGVDHCWRWSWIDYCSGDCVPSEQIGRDMVWKAERRGGTQGRCGIGRNH